MAEKPKSVQEKVAIRPTPIGARVIQRLSIPHIDKSGELRRLRELGFAAELAGFNLDGSVLRHGGRVWDLRSELEHKSTGEHSAMTSPQPSTPSASEVTSVFVEPKPVPAASAQTQPLAPPNAEASVEPAANQESSLRSNLRGLSG